MNYLEELSSIIIKNIKQEFSAKHLSGNLVNTVYVTKGANGELKIHIPAETYNILEYLSKGVIIHNGKGSYASSLDTEGSYLPGTDLRPGNHKGYIERVIDKSIMEWRGKNIEKIEKK